jgi:hypothetical protein
MVNLCSSKLRDEYRPNKKSTVAVTTKDDLRYEDRISVGTRRISA